MYLDFWQLGKKPFENTPDPEFFFPSKEHDEALHRLQYVVEGNKGAALLTGDYGTGKTTIIRKIASETIDSGVALAYLNNPRWSPDELLQDILYQLDEEDIPSNSMELGRRIGDVLYENTANDRSTLVIIDEAQLISSDMVFEELRLLLNFQLNDKFMVTLLLVGQPELREKVLAIPQLEQRMFIKYHLHTFDLENTQKYIHHRLKLAGTKKELFTEDAVQEIYSYSFGVPRRINNICDLSLMTGAEKNVKKIDDKLVKSLM